MLILEENGTGLQLLLDKSEYERLTHAEKRIYERECKKSFGKLYILS